MLKSIRKFFNQEIKSAKRITNDFKNTAKSSIRDIRSVTKVTRSQKRKTVNKVLRKLPKNK